MCSLVNQNSTSGKNVSTLDDAYNQFARAQGCGRRTAAGNRVRQRWYRHEIHQESSGFCKIVTKQKEHQVLRAVRANVAQSQHGPVRKGVGSNQACGADSVWTGTQDSSQVLTSRLTEADIGSLVFASAGLQDNLVEYFGVSAGSIHAAQSVSEQMNGHPERVQNSCPTSDTPDDAVCAAVITRVEGSCTSPESATPCPPGELPNSTTGKCEVLPLIESEQL
ncbi:MAG: hypothetical protein H0W90_03035 [Actinobacteria bacterium]|nr:hypothetical protein [Actinomycetota bacterium]